MFQLWSRVYLGKAQTTRCLLYRHSKWTTRGRYDNETNHFCGISKAGRATRVKWLLLSSRQDNKSRARDPWEKAAVLAIGPTKRGGMSLLISTALSLSGLGPPWETIGLSRANETNDNIELKSRLTNGTTDRRQRELSLLRHTGSKTSTSPTTYWFGCYGRRTVELVCCVLFLWRSLERRCRGMLGGCGLRIPVLNHLRPGP